LLNVKKTFKAKSIEQKRRGDMKCTPTLRQYKKGVLKEIEFFIYFFFLCVQKVIIIFWKY